MAPWRTPSRRCPPQSNANPNPNPNANSNSNPHPHPAPNPHQVSAAIEALLVFEEVQPLAFGDIMDALKDLQPTLSQALQVIIGFLQINGSFLSTFKVPWPAELRSLLVIFGAFNLDFVDPDAAPSWLGRSIHYGTTTPANPDPSPSPSPNPNPNPNP